MGIFYNPKTKCAVCGTQVDAVLQNTNLGKYYCSEHLQEAKDESARINAEFVARTALENAEREARLQKEAQEQAARLAQYRAEDEAKRAAKVAAAAAKLHPTEKQVEFIHTLVSRLVSGYETKLESYRKTNPVYADAYQEELSVYAELIRFVGNVFAGELTSKEASTLIDLLKFSSSVDDVGKDIERFFPKMVAQFVATKK